MRLIIRITRTTISFTAPNTVIEGQTDFEQYSMKTGISVAANMRQALADCRLLQVHTSPTQNGQTMPSQYHPVFSQVRVYVDTPLLLIPAEEFDADAAPPTLSSRQHHLRERRRRHHTDSCRQCRGSLRRGQGPALRAHGAFPTRRVPTSARSRHHRVQPLRLGRIPGEDVLLLPRPPRRHLLVP